MLSNINDYCQLLSGIVNVISIRYDNGQYIL